MTTIEQPRRYGLGSEKPRGFAAMHPDEVRRIASMGGTKAQAMKVAHRFTKEEAREAGRIGGAKSRRRGPNKNYKPQEQV
jgi:hypothetical protein